MDDFVRWPLTSERHNARCNQTGVLTANGVEWMRFDPDCPLPELVKTVPHVAFEVDDLEAELAGKDILIQPNSPSTGVTAAFIVDNGAPIEFLCFSPAQKE
jgi:hypothetical protein